MEQPCHHGYTCVPNITPDLSISVCAVCFTEARIAEVKATQAALSRRGGIFDSSNAGGEWCTTESNAKKWMTHRDWTKQWRRTRLNCWRLEATLEKLQDERCDMAEQWGLDEALYIWELAKDECSQVPGYGHTGDFVSTKVQDTQAVLKPASAEEQSSGEDWETVKCRWKKRSQPLKSLLQDEPEKAVTKETNSVINRLKHLGCTSENRFKALIKHDTNVVTKLAEPIERPRHSPNGDAIPKTPDSVRETAWMEPRSALKCNSPSTSRSNKSVVINAQATILPLGTTPVTTTPHHEHTVAEKSHRRLTYNRNSRSYIPSCWASPEGYEKYNTSHCKDTWATIDRLQKGFATSKEEEQEYWDEEDETLTEEGEKSAIEEGEAADKGEENIRSPFQARLPPWQPGQKMFSMKQRVCESINERLDCLGRQ